VSIFVALLLALLPGNSPAVVPNFCQALLSPQLTGTRSGGAWISVNSQDFNEGRITGFDEYSIERFEKPQHELVKHKEKALDCGRSSGGTFCYGRQNSLIDGFLPHVVTPERRNCWTGEPAICRW